ncbi:hypothetical protein BGX38DRAFT_1275196 [Terfezia claveryi]|nr:hypothetical protein BGX38DRAFT_1275196 [Terfezia claveryi]
MKAELKKFDHVLANFAGCSVRRPVDTLLAVARKKVERFYEELRLKEEYNKEGERRDIELCRVQEELQEAKAQIARLSQPSTSKRESTDIGVQVSVEIEDASTQSNPVETGEIGIVGIKVLEEVLRRKKEKKQGKEGKKKIEGKGKGKVRAKDSTSAGLSPYEDLSDYEKEVEEIVRDEALVIPPVTKKQPAVRQTGPKVAKSPAAKYKKPAKPVKVKDDDNAGDYWSTLAPGKQENGQNY